jgi:sulfite reductase (NADPH) hemoprotein beta-component
MIAGMNARWDFTEPTELDRFEETVRLFLRGDIDSERFTAFRLQQGVYGQRQAGVHMVRIKLPGGRLVPQQLVGIAEVIEKYTEHQIAHISTRQDIQLHHIPTANTPALLRHLGKYGLTTREACGNTVRNMTACALTGSCPREHVDVTTHLEGAVNHFLRHPLTQHMPRKFKISFSACEADCAQGTMHDIGVVATHKDGKFGFKVLAGGGLGHKPHEALVIEPFLEEKDLLPCMEAVVSLHHRYSDRKRRAKARVKFLVDRFGADGFLEKYREEYARTKAAFSNREFPKGEWKLGQPGPAPGAGAPRKVFPIKPVGQVTFSIAAKIGDVTPAQLRGIAAVMEREDLVDIRATQDQNFLIVGVPQAKVPALRAGIVALGLREPQAGDDVVACPGTSTCKLGITSSKILGAMLDGGPEDLRIRVSGCHNSCAQPDTGDIGLYGEGRRLFGKLIPHYVLQLGGNGMAGGALTFDGPEIPAVRAPQAVERIKQTFRSDRNGDESFFDWSRRRGEKYFEALLADLAKVEEADVAAVLSDHGEQSAFKVSQFGGGECAGANQEQASALFFEAAYERSCRNAFGYEHKYQEALECQEAVARLTAQATLFAATHKSTTVELGTLRELIRESAPELTEAADALIQGIENFRAQLDHDSYQSLAARSDEWMRKAARFCESRDPLLDLSQSVPHGDQRVLKAAETATRNRATA